MSLKLSDLEIYSFADPASGRHTGKKRQLARQAIVTVARDWLERWYVLEAWAGRETPTQLKDRILSVFDYWRPRIMGIEANGMQVLFGSLIRDEANRRFGHVRMMPVYQPTNVHKDFRIRNGLEPIIMSGRLFMQTQQTDLMVELRGFPTAATKDLVDALESAIRMAPKRAIKNEKTTELDQYAQYLRNSGCPAGQITKKLDDYRKKLYSGKNVSNSQ